MDNAYDNNLKIVAGWLKDISSTLNTELVLDEEGICTLQIGGDQIVAIEVSRDFDMVYLYSPLIHAPKEDVESNVMLMNKALELNAFQMHTRGGAIGLIPNSNVFVYSTSLPLQGMDVDMFGNALLAFRETALELKTILSSDLLPTPDQPINKTIIKI